MRAVSRRAVLGAALGGVVTAAGGCAGDATTATSPHGSVPGGATRGGPPPHPPSPSTPESAGPRPGGPVPEIVAGPPTRPLVALTFHGDGDPRLATRLLEEAERAGARLTVLAVGAWLDAYPQMARRVLAGGHELGNHTQSHADMSQMDVATAYAEISGCARRLRRLTGSPGRWFRPSQTRLSTPLVRVQAGRAGYRSVLSYGVDPLDYTDPGPAAVTEGVLRQVRRGSVVSLHLGHADTVAALPAVLSGLRARGLSAVTAGALLS